MQTDRLTLRAYYEKFHSRLFLCDAEPATLDAYRWTLTKWDRLTSNPTIDQITNHTLAEFKAALKSLGLSNATVNKHLRHTQAMLNKIGPSGPGNRDALQLINHCPWTKPLRQKRPRPRVVTAELLRRVHHACQHARRPLLNQKLNRSFAAAWWRALIVCAYNTGLRRNALLTLKWLNIDIAARCIIVKADEDKCHQERTKPLNAGCVFHLTKIKVPDDKSFVFPWPHSPKTFDKDFHRIQDMADIPTAEHFGLHDLKRTCGTMLAKHSSPWAVQMMLDHASIETARHYVNASEELREAVDVIPQPWSST